MMVVGEIVLCGAEGAKTEAGLNSQAKEPLLDCTLENTFLKTLPTESPVGKSLRSKDRDKEVYIPFCLFFIFP